MQRTRSGIVVVLSGLVVVSGCSSNKDPAPDEPPQVVAKPAVPKPDQPEPEPASVAPPKVDPPAGPTPKVDPPTVDPHARRRLAADAYGQFGVGPGYLYWCDGNVVRGIPKNGDTKISIGACDGSFQFMGDRHGIYYCDERGLYRGMPGNETATQVASVDACILGAVDNTDVYFIVPGFDGISDPGLYKLARSGGDPRRVLPTRKGEQITIALDGGDIWVTSFFAGTIQKLAKSGGKSVTVVSGQKSLVGVAADDKYLYWIVQQSAEARRRSKRGGPIERVGTEVGSQVIAYGKAVYWADGVKEVLVDEVDPVPTGRVMRLAQGAQAAEPIETQLLNPRIAIDADGLYISELRKPGVLFIPNVLVKPN